MEFPTYKEPSSGGPPWALPPEVYVEHLMRPGEEVEYDGDGRIVVSEEFMGMRGEKLEGGMFRRVKHYQPRETHEIGKGTDWVGVWERV